MHRSQNGKKRRSCKSSQRHHQQPAKSHDKENDVVDVLQNREDTCKNFEKPVKSNGGNEEYPYEIKDSEVMGRYLVASRNLEPGDVIIMAEPIVVGPYTGCDLICLGCYHPIVGNPFKCKDCSWPLCGDECIGFHQPLGHSIEECSILKKHTKLDYTDLNEVKDLYQTIVPIRCLLLKTNDPKKWKMLHEMVAHNSIRKKRVELWKSNQLMVVDKIRKMWGMTQYEEDEIHTICGILEVNAFEVGQLGASIRALYPRAYLLAHDCTPNTTHTDDSRRRITIRAATKIIKGDAITLSYAYTLQSTHKRREHLVESKFFECCCTRCKDPTELGTFACALKCPKCGMAANRDVVLQAMLNGDCPKKMEVKSKPGVVLPTDPLDPNAPWRCDTCPSYTISAASVKTVVQRLSDEHDKIDVNDVEGFEAFLHMYRNMLHPNHFLCLSAKYALSQLYGKVDSHLIHKMSLSQLQRKRDICRDILKVFDALEPGYSRLRGITLYELHAPLMILTTRDYEKNELSKNELRIRLKEVVKCLEESVKILNYEPKESSEGIMATAAIDALLRIKDWEKIIGKI
ncbi:SET and MYND domain containing, arthropod-specific, member 4 isoform X2 [Arctopsyche grandis]|uniref:SET and MYND domain containing, arthropod-specific, member 4 isoform X2 n=1 Tax=Arctopsyche grandis TaxID=121162 RepID=UPI00406D7A83